MKTPDDLIPIIKQKFNEEFPDAALEIKEGRMPSKAPALAMYHAFKRGWLNGYNLGMIDGTKEY